MKRLYAWLPVVVWMGIIFLLSARSRIQVSDEETTNFLIFKTLHMIEYALLYTFTYRAVRFEQKYESTSKWQFLAFVISIIYSASDEIHQTFVPTREGHPRDVIIDAIGILLAWIIIKQFIPILPKKLRHLASNWLQV